jgi:hypothetical protein
MQSVSMGTDMYLPYGGGAGIETELITDIVSL